MVGEVRISPGMVRFPMNLINGWRSAWAAAWRRALVANIFAFLLFFSIFSGRAALLVWTLWLWAGSGDLAVNFAEHWSFARVSIGCGV